MACITKDSPDQFTFTLFVNENDPAKEVCVDSVLSPLLSASGPARRLPRLVQIWTGPRTGVPNAQAIFGADEAFSVTEMPSVLRDKMAKSSVVYFDASSNSAHAQMVSKLLGQFADTERPTFLSPVSAMHSLRVVKSQSEIELMRASCEIAAQAMKEVRSLTSE